MKNKLRISITLIVIFTLLVSNLSFAVSPQSSESKVLKDIKKIERYVYRNDDGTFSIQEKGLKKLKDVEILSGIQENMKIVNEMVQDGIIITQDDLKVYANPKYILKGNLKNSKSKYVDYDHFFVEKDDSGINVDIMDKEISLSLGINTYATSDGYTPEVGYFVYWWGWVLSLDDSATCNLVDAMWGGASASGLAAVLCAEGIISWPGALPSGILGGILGVGAAAISITNRVGGSHGVYFTWVSLINMPVLGARG